MLWAVLMAGGSGTRFWPESRESRPKQFLSFFEKKTLLEQTCRRLSPLVPRQRILVVTQASKVQLVRKLTGLPQSQILGEPVGRNTAPCAVLAARLILEKDPQAVIALLPADHRIQKEPLFRKTLQAAAEAAAHTGLPVTFGIRPCAPHTGYGYLEMGPFFESRRGFRIRRLKRFHEKPGAAKARRYFESGKFLWNSGMFVWKAAALLAAARTHLPQAVRLADLIASMRFKEGMRKYYPKMPNISMDYALMEPLAGRILTCPADFGWSDVGSWECLREFCAPDAKGNVASGKTLFVESSGNIVKSSGKLVVVMGMNNHLVVETADALLVCPVEKTQSIRAVVRELKMRKMHAYL